MFSLDYSRPWPPQRWKGGQKKGGGKGEMLRSAIPGTGMGPGREATRSWTGRSVPEPENVHTSRECSLSGHE